MEEIDTIFSILKDANVKVEKGLSGSELGDIYEEFGIIFPPDLRAMLQEGLPVSKGFPDWRNGDMKLIKEKMEWPLEGIVFDITHSNFWYEKWGNKPKDLEKAVEIAKEKVLEEPKMIPIYAHRYIPSLPNKSGNPVFSIHQTDIIYYGKNLLQYVKNEFDTETARDFSEDNIREIEFWSELVELNSLPAKF